MRLLEEGLRRLHTEPTKRFRETLFSRLEAEGAIPPRKKPPARAWRRAALPLAAAAAIGLFLLVSRESVRERPAPGPSTARVETPPSVGPDPEPAPPMATSPGAASPALSPDEMEMIALLDVLSGPISFEAGEDVEALDLMDALGRSGA